MTATGVWRWFRPTGLIIGTTNHPAVPGVVRALNEMQEGGCPIVRKSASTPAGECTARPDLPRGDPSTGHGVQRPDRGAPAGIWEA